MRRAGGSRRPQALPHPRAGHRRRQQPEAGRLPRAAERPRRDRLPAAARSGRRRRAVRSAESRAGDPQPHARRASACRCRPAACVLFAGGARPADPARRGRDRATARSARMSRSTSARRPASPPRSTDAEDGPATGRIIVLTVTNDQAGAGPLRGRVRRSTTASSFRPRDAPGRRDGLPLWAVTVPANGSATLRYRAESDRRRLSR